MLFIFLMKINISLERLWKISLNLVDTSHPALRRRYFPYKNPLCLKWVTMALSKPVSRATPMCSIISYDAGQDAGEI